MAKDLKGYKQSRRRKFVGLDKNGNPPVFPYVKVQYSSIHGHGLFAAKKVPKNKYFIQYIGEIIRKKESKNRGMTQFESSVNSEEGSVYIFDLDDKYDLDGGFDWNIARLANHSCRPNCESHDLKGEIWFIALRDIKKGEEMTFNYGYDLEHWEEHPCRCGEPNCIGYIAREEDRKKLRKILKQREEIRS